MAELTGAEVDRVLALPKLIEQRVNWEQAVHGKQVRWRLTAKVVAPGTPYVLQLNGTYGYTKWGFALVWSNVPVRRLDFTDQCHKNPDGSMICAPHKHRWDELNLGRDAYLPTDIDFTDVDTGLLGFLAECRIQLMGDYLPLSIV